MDRLAYILTRETQTVFIKAKQRHYKRLRPLRDVSCKGVVLRERQLAGYRQAAQ